MEKRSMFMVRRNQYCESGHTAQSNLQTQRYPHQATIDFLYRTGKNHQELHVEPKESPHSQVNSKQKKRKKKKPQQEASHYQTSNYTTRLQ